MDSKKYWDEVVPDWVKDAIAKGDVVTVTPQETFSLDLHRDEASVLIQVLQKAIPNLPEDDSWLAFQMLGDLQVLMDNYDKETT